jgi:hypothetical protein
MTTINKFIKMRSTKTSLKEQFSDSRYYPKERQTRRVSAFIEESGKKESGVIIGRFHDRYRIRFDDGYTGVFHEDEIDWET